MKKALLYRLFGVGKLPPAAAQALASEDIVLSDEGIRSSLTYRNFRSPGRISSYRKVGLITSMAVTSKRLAAFSGTNAIIDVELTDPRIKQISLSIEPNGALLAAFDASLFHDDWSGDLEYRFKTPLSKQIIDQIGIGSRKH
ncbi:MAG: hypothetical protein QM785_04965 [Pyrinomonadaceae bacterium]